MYISICSQKKYICQAVIRISLQHNNSTKSLYNMLYVITFVCMNSVWQRHYSPDSHLLFLTHRSEWIVLLHKKKTGKTIYHLGNILLQKHCCQATSITDIHWEREEEKSLHILAYCMCVVFIVGCFVTFLIHSGMFVLPLAADGRHGGVTETYRTVGT